MLLFFAFKLLNIHKLAMLEKMLAQSSKISISFKLNLAKVGMSNYKIKYDNFMKDLGEKVKD